MSEKSLFEKLGGAPAIDAVVESFYEKVLNDDKLKSFFTSTNMRNHKPKMKKFLEYAFGGGTVWKGRSMEASHASLNIKNVDFDNVMGHLAATLIEFNVPGELITQAAAIAESVRPAICVD